MLIYRPDDDFFPFSGHDTEGDSLAAADEKPLIDYRTLELSPTGEILDKEVARALWNQIGEPIHYGPK